jgi:Flp pilus assembly pilin Flp
LLSAASDEDTHSTQQEDLLMSLYLYNALRSLLARVESEDGQTAVEYGLVLAAIAIAVVAALATGLLGDGGPIDDLIDEIGAAISGAL